MLVQEFENSLKEIKDRRSITMKYWLGKYRLAVCFFDEALDKTGKRNHLDEAEILKEC